MHIMKAITSFYVILNLESQDFTSRECQEFNQNLVKEMFLLIEERILSLCVSFDLFCIQPQTQVGHVMEGIYLM